MQKIPKLKKLLIPLLEGKRILLSHEMYNDGTNEEPDIIFYDLFAKKEAERYNPECYDIVVSLQKSNHEHYFGKTEIYRFPVIDDLNVLEKILRYSIDQFHV
ncbi:MAG: hypothetical protein PVJ67_04500 [Candidatus Pacearchaeota archaeon]|jgi:hypothetical protein